LLKGCGVSKAARFTKADVKRAAMGVASAGLPVASVRIDPNGHIEVLLGKPKEAHRSDEWADLE
jgi:hypothetical protein